MMINVVFLSFLDLLRLVSHHHGHQNVDRKREGSTPSVMFRRANLKNTMSNLYETVYYSAQRGLEKSFYVHDSFRTRLSACLHLH